MLKKYLIVMLFITVGTATKNMEASDKSSWSNASTIFNNTLSGVKYEIQRNINDIKQAPFLSLAFLGGALLSNVYTISLITYMMHHKLLEKIPSTDQLTEKSIPLYRWHEDEWEDAQSILQVSQNNTAYFLHTLENAALGAENSAHLGKELYLSSFVKILERDLRILRSYYSIASFAKTWVIGLRDLMKPLEKKMAFYIKRGQALRAAIVTTHRYKEELRISGQRKALDRSRKNTNIILQGQY